MCFVTNSCIHYVKKIINCICKCFCKHDMELMCVLADKKSGNYSAVYQCNKCGYILNIDH